jgi:hypothetical protein
MHGQNMAHAVVGHQTFAPRPRWFVGGGSTLQSAPPLIAIETDFSIRPFTRQRRGMPCGLPRNRVNAPGLYFQNHPGSSASLVWLLAPAFVGPVWPFRSAITAMKPLAKRSFRDSSFVFRPPLPSRTD